MVNLIETVQSRLTPELVSKVANAVGESPEKTAGAASSMVPSAFAGLIQKGTSEGGIAQLLTGLKDFQAAETFAQPTDPKGIMGKGQRLVSSMFGKSGGAIADVVARSSGVRPEAANGILSFVAPMIAGVLGKHVLTRGLGAAGLAELLSSQRKAILDHPNLPQGLAGALGLSDLSQVGARPDVIEEPHVSVGRSVAPAAAPAPRVLHETTRVTAPAAGNRTRTPWGAIAGAVGIGALFVAGLIYFTRDVGHQEIGTVASEAPIPRAPEAVLPNSPRAIPPPEPRDEQPTSETTTTGATLERPGGTETTAGTMDSKKDPASADESMDEKAPAMPLVEGDIVTHFVETSRPLPDRIELDTVVFDVGSAEPMTGWNSALDSVAEAMKAHPNAKIRVEGYTDATGSSDLNAKLSYDRAKRIKELLVDKGVSASRIDIVGRSERAPVADNATPEGRQQNRRVDILLLSR